MLSTTAQTTRAPSTKGRRAPDAVDARQEETTPNRIIAQDLRSIIPAQPKCQFKPGRESVLMKLKALLVPAAWARCIALETRGSIGVSPSKACRRHLRRIPNVW